MFKPSLSFLAAGILPAAAIPAFPGAEGYGANANGGRGGDVYHVTNLNASGAGSFAEAIGTVPAAGRTIVFDVSGYIRLPSGSDGTRLTSSKVTIAGQTAPGDGIGFYNNFFRISGDDIIVRHVRFRHGYYGSGGDCIDLDSGCLNAVLDHVSMQFSTDENMSSFGSPPENLTLQYSLNAWGLESHSCGGLWDQNHATSHHNLWAHNHTRNPKARPGGLLEWVNNVTYDWDIGFIMGDSQSNQNWKSNVINNYFIGPPGNTHSKALVKGTVGDNGKPNFTVFLGGNLSDTDGDGLLNGTDKGYGIVEGTSYAPGTTGLTPGALGYYQSSTAIAGSTAGVSTDAPLLAYKKIVSNAGALRLDANYPGSIRDEVDTILIGKLTTQTPFHVHKESDTGASNAGFGVLASTIAPVDTDLDGMPDYYESALGWAPAVQDHNTGLPNSGGVLTGTTFMPAGTAAGYTRLEEYLHFLAIPHGTVAKNTASEPTSVQVDLKRFTSGFSASPVFTVSNIASGTIVQSGPGNSLVTFTPTVNFVGRARFDFTVTDASGLPWTQTFALLVTNAGLPRDLEWQGGLASNAWDSATNNWLRNGNPTAFQFGDRVAFDDSGSKTPSLNLTESVAPGTVDFDATGNYTIAGTGAITSTGALTKRGTGTLTISNTAANSFSNAILDAGTLSLGNETANASGLGTGPLTMNSGTLNLYNTGPGGSFTGTLPNPLIVNGEVAVNAGARCGFSGALSGAGTLNLFIPYIRTDWGGNPASFTGTLNVLTDADGGEFRINSGGTGNITNYGAARLRLPNNINAYYLPNPPSSGDKTQTIQIGELSTSGTGAGVILGGANGAADRSVHWKVGALNTDATFGGSIQNRTGPALFTKLGSGTLTLTGASTATGATTVSSGTLLIDGSLGNTTVTVASKTALGGSGSVAGPIIASADASISPGSGPTGATFTANGGLTLSGNNTLIYDMANTPAGANDRIAMNGTLAMTGALNFWFKLRQGPLQAGTYDLITGATNSTVTGVTLTHDLPTNSRQTFALGRSAAGSNPSKVWLTVTGNPAVLTWTGAANGTWDTVTPGNWTGASPDTFFNNDDVVLDDSATTRTVTLSGTVSPRTATITTTAGYNLTGTGSLGGNAALIKNGSGTLTLSNTGANTHTGGLILNAGEVALANDVANNNGVGSGTVTLNGGVLSMYDNDSTYSVFGAIFNVPAGATARLNADSRVDLYGFLSGAGTLNYYVPWVRTTMLCDWSAFTGTINVLTDASGGDLRMGTNYNFPGFPQASVALTDRVYAYYIGTLAQGAGTTIPIGALSGTALSTLQGGATGGRALTYRIGGKNTDTTFAGTISEQNTGTATTYVKTGTGTWTLSGSGAWNGGTTVEQGTLRLTGPFSSATAAQVMPGATLKIEGGSLATDATKIASGASCSGYGTLASDFVHDGTFDGRGYLTGTPGILTVQGSAFLGSTSLTRLRSGASSDLIAITGDLTLGGTVQVALAPGTAFGRYPLFTYGGTLSGSATLAGIPVGTTAHLSTTTAGQVTLVIDDTDEDGLPDSWEQANFGNLTQTANGDKDGDGTSNLAEYRLGLNPSSGTSSFKSTVSPNGRTITWPSANGIVFTVKRSLTLGEASWQTLGTVTGTAATTASFTDPTSFGKAFYKVEFTP
ncbi:autotransporter-associated beta strand repeat-containing protein [Luteolibacter soli]|uniref:Autotransporter-associated beta strand repeat-containing protein n=1 Tax=Luteolibacter soli TaxID=3135280 RepID=A0ABU9AWW6_9BACT